MGRRGGRAVFPEQSRRHASTTSRGRCSRGGAGGGRDDARLAGRRPFDAALFALAPLLVLHGTTNWDHGRDGADLRRLLRSVAEQPGRPAGVWIGLATAAKLYPLLLLLPLGLLCLRAGRLPAFWRAAVPALLVPVLVTAPVYLTSPSFAEVDGTQVAVAGSPLERLGVDGLAALAPRTVLPDGTVGINAAYRFVELNSTRPADWDSLWYALQRLRGTSLDGVVPAGQAPTVLNTAVAVSLLLGLAGVALLALRAPRRPRLAQLAFLVVVVFLVTNKVWSPQFSLWLVPLLRWPGRAGGRSWPGRPPRRCCC
jgi:hypothetical protein